MARTRLKIARQTLIDHLQGLLDEARTQYDARVAAFEAETKDWNNTLEKWKRDTIQWHGRFSRAMRDGKGEWVLQSYQGEYGMPTFVPEDETLLKKPELPCPQGAGTWENWQISHHTNVREVERELKLLKLAVDENLTLTADDHYRFFGDSLY